MPITHLQHRSPPASRQLSLQPTVRPFEGMPNTRYQGSKRKLLPWLYEIFKSLDFSTCLDAFGGTGSITHLLRHMGKRVDYLDILPSNALIAQALIGNADDTLNEKELCVLFKRKRDKRYLDHISINYSGIYFTDEENTQLDVLCQNILATKNLQKRANAFYCLFQAAISKRPYNLFHRANLEMRLRDVERSFGNKTTWDRPFLAHMKKFSKELSVYYQRQAPHPTKVICGDAFTNRNVDYDLVYIDTPYAKSKGTQESNYFNFYHFLDACVNYYDIPKLIQKDFAHKPIYSPTQNWHPCKDVLNAFEILFERYQKSKLVISYRSDGVPTPDELSAALKSFYKKVTVYSSEKYNYVLSTKKSNTKEIVIVARN